MALPAPLTPTEELAALLCASQHLRARFDELMADLEVLRQRMAQLYIDVAPEHDRRQQQRRQTSRGE